MALRIFVNAALKRLHCLSFCEFEGFSGENGNLAISSLAAIFVSFHQGKEKEVNFYPNCHKRMRVKNVVAHYFFNTIRKVVPLFTSDLCTKILPL
jgi:hypothetical protein